MDPNESRQPEEFEGDVRAFVDQDDPGSFLRSRGITSTSALSNQSGVHLLTATTAATIEHTDPPTTPPDSEVGIQPLLTGPVPGMTFGKGLMKLARPSQWIKNLLVFVAPAAGGVLFHWSVLWHAAGGFGIFCLAASGTYYLNDVRDADEDRRHPTKRFRPVASGVVPVPLALVIAVTALSSSIGLSVALAGVNLAIVMTLYAIVNIGYSMGLKNEPILDLALVSAGFVLRAIAGGVATGVPLSNWFIIVACFGALLIVTGKRSGEKKLLSTVRIDQGATRQTLGLYTPEFLRGVLTMSAAVTVTAYCLWAFERASTVHDGHHPIWFQLTIIPFVVALLYTVRLLNSGAGAAPEDLAIHDHRLQTYGLCWVILFVVATYS